ncbi:Nitrate reductase [Thalassoglobus neptunius]|uniref:Nitrate reductase n=1 Tax=Thalassoglobus neptunius TaxID=1938619 RepID=A0A5C5W674_9PLAN|nr:nitrate reductase [Thalassoglobus neptunius]TWT46386.1 Nitrate reductase [Thalassoglobus neptunius]
MLTRELLREPGIHGLGQVPASLAPNGTTQTVCGYCSTGCGLRVHLQDNVGINLTPTTEYPVNLGMACPKGWEALTVLDAPNRATTPLLKNASGEFVAVDWEVALREFTGRFQSIQKDYGTESVAFLSTGQIPCEEMAFLGALTKFGMGIKHGDGNTRQCMATAVVAYKQAFGFDAPPYTYADFEESDCLTFVGSNPCIAHPIMWERVMRNGCSPEIIVVDPRSTETAMYATQHLAIAPKSDQSLFYGVARILIRNGWIDQKFVSDSTDGFNEFATFVDDYTVSRVAGETGLKPEQIERFAETIHERKRCSFWWTMVVNQSYQGVRTAQAIINVALMTGNLGRPGTGANSITGQCNAMGSRLFSNTTNLLGGHDFANAEHRKKVASILNIDAERIPSEGSWAYNEIMEGILKKKIRGLWVICTNTAHSWINQNLARDILDRLDFLVVQDMYHDTETAQMADLVLPAAGWGEKEGTFVNSERRFGVIKKVRRAPVQALSDFSIFRLIAESYGCGEMFANWDSPEKVFQLLKECTRDMPCDITGTADYEMIEANGGIQWPLSEGVTEFDQERRLFSDGKFSTPSGRAKFLFEPPKSLSEPVSEKYPFVLLTGRGSASQWHTQTRSSRSAVLKKLYPIDPFVELNPSDARQLGIRPNEWVIIESQRGRMRAMTLLTRSVSAGQLFIPMHYEGTNQLTDAVFDPYSKQPSYKSCAVRISKDSSSTASARQN